VAGPSCAAASAAGAVPSLGGSAVFAGSSRGSCALCGGGSAINLETTPEARYWLQPENGIMVHANHFKCPIARAAVTDIGLMRCPESLYRDQRLLDLFNKHRGAITIDTFKEGFQDRFGAPDAILRSPKARPGGNISGTVATIIMDTTANTMFVAPSPYLGVHFTAYQLDC